VIVPLDEIINPKTVKVVKAEGMPIQSDEKIENFNKPHQKGDLYIKFDITFPSQLSEEQRNELKKNLPP